MYNITIIIYIMEIEVLNTILNKKPVMSVQNAQNNLIAYYMRGRVVDTQNISFRFSVKA